jgi:hypothetical protein
MSDIMTTSIKRDALYSEIDASTYPLDNFPQDIIKRNAPAVAKLQQGNNSGTIYWLYCDDAGYKVKISCRYPTIYQDGDIDTHNNLIVIGLYITDTWVKNTPTWFYRIEGSQIECKNVVNMLTGLQFYNLKKS